MPDHWDIAVSSARWSTDNIAAEYALDGYKPAARRPHLRVMEYAANGEVVDPDVACQLDEADGIVTAVFLLKGMTAARRRRYFRISQADSEPDSEALVKLRHDVVYQEQESYEIATPGATYFYHKRGAGFASIIDRDGKDWLSYRPHGGSDGAYRGIPNLAHPENYFHPGGAGCRSRILNAGPLKITIASESLDGQVGLPLGDLRQPCAADGAKGGPSLLVSLRRNAGRRA